MNTFGWIVLMLGVLIFVVASVKIFRDLRTKRKQSYLENIAFALFGLFLAFTGALYIIPKQEALEQYYNGWLGWLVVPIFLLGVVLYDLITAVIRRKKKN